MFMYRKLHTHVTGSDEDEIPVKMQRVCMEQETLIITCHRLSLAALQGRGPSLLRAEKRVSQNFSVSGSRVVRRDRSGAGSRKAAGHRQKTHSLCIF